ncbi:MAG: hypothetical protein QXZ70_08540 [Candidatus Bathyarchaeia archaeon]
MAAAITLGSVVYVRYKDHVLYRNIRDPIEEAVERETVGWLTRDNGDIILIEHDRTPQCLQLPRGSGSGVIILKSCILELRCLLFPCFSDGSLNLTEANGTSTECAFQTKKRKTQQKERTGANR